MGLAYKQRGFSLLKNLFATRNYIIERMGSQPLAGDALRELGAGQQIRV